MNPIEMAARALARLEGVPAGTRLEGRPMWESYVDQVRAVLEAVREPDVEMQRAAFAEKVWFLPTGGMAALGQVGIEHSPERDQGASTIWRAMIDALLHKTVAS